MCEFADVWVCSFTIIIMAAIKKEIKPQVQQQTTQPTTQQNSNHDIFATMHQCSYCSESFFSGYSLISHMRIHNKGKGALVDNTTTGGSAFPGFPPPSSSSSSSSNVQNNQVMDYSWHQGSW